MNGEDAREQIAQGGSGRVVFTVVPSINDLVWNSGNQQSNVSNEKINKRARSQNDEGVFSPQKHQGTTTGAPGTLSNSSPQADSSMRPLIIEKLVGVSFHIGVDSSAQIFKMLKEL